MGGKMNKWLRGQIPTSIFFIFFGLCLVLVPKSTLNLLLKVVFGLLLIGAGLYQVYIYAAEKENATILDLFSGVIVLVMGVFLFTNPQIVVKLLPQMLGAFVLVDSIWLLRGCRKLKKRRAEIWKVFLIASLVFVALGIFLMAYPFQTVNNMILFAGWTFLVNGVLDVVFYILLKKGMKKEIPPLNEQQDTEKTVVQAEPAAEVKAPEKEAEKSPEETAPAAETPEKEAVEEVVSVETEAVAEEIQKEIQEETIEEIKEEIKEETEEETKVPEEEELPEWKD